MPAELAAIDRLLADPAILAPLLANLDPVRGLPSVPAAQVLRLLYPSFRKSAGLKIGNFSRK